MQGWAELVQLDQVHEELEAASPQEFRHFAPVDVARTVHMSANSRQAALRTPVHSELRSICLLVQQPEWAPAAAAIGTATSPSTGTHGCSL